MSISGTLSNYYVDSIISHESDELSGPARFPGVQYSGSSSAAAAAAAAAGGRQPGGAAHAEHPHPDSYPSCSFQPKPPVFSSSWSPFSPHHGASGLPAVYHPYIPAQHVPAADTRYLRSWLDCAPPPPPPRGSESAPGQGQAGQVKLEPQLGHLGAGDIVPKIGGLLQHETTTYILESASTAAARELSHPAAVPRAAFDDNKDICEGSEDKDGLEQRLLAAVSCSFIWLPCGRTISSSLDTCKCLGGSSWLWTLSACTGPEGLLGPGNAGTKYRWVIRASFKNKCGKH
ncbi:Homeobox protein Hox-B9a [Liparis tanakae]|uniref:Homeobox protein Hox-B9a n=1 Tax=Liparis tanakae TaxID=230148 RepID=A0A4Z2FJH1_9TELE|nr:Homeobox protein Hox-B9a [Liparis tanakae]